MTIRVIPYSDNYEQEWRRFVSSREDATIFHTIEWKRVMEDTFGYSQKYSIVLSDGHIVGILPAFGVKKIIGNAIVSQPFFEYGGLMVEGESEEIYRELLAYYKKLVADQRFNYMEIRSVPGSNENFYTSNGYAKEFKAYGFYIDVKDKDFEKDIWLSLYTKKSRVRNSVKNAISNGLRVVEKRDVHTYYELYLRTMSKLGSPPLPYELFANIDKYLGPNVRFTFAENDQSTIAAMMSFPFNKRDLMVGLASDQENQKLHANDLLYNEQIEYATRSKFNIVDFGRTRPNSNYEQFKSKWGATKVELCSYIYPCSANASIDPYKNYLMVAHITKKMPWIFTKTPLGPFLIKKFP